jgi:O-antigen/teichoic acid export membrane protein
LQSVRRKIAFQVVVSNLSTAMNFALAIILARLLSPDDIGVFSMSAVLIAIAHTFRDFGVSSYIKREKELTDQIIRTGRGLLYITSWAMALVMYFSAAFWAKFFNEPRVEEVVHVLSLGFIFIPFGAIAAAIMNRELNVLQSSKVAAVSTVAYFIISVSLALMGFKHMTMAWANLANILITGLAYNFFLNQRIPQMPSLRGWRSMVSFGTANVLTALCKVINTSIPDLVLGRLSVAADVGLFSRASSTVNMVGKVIEPSINYFTLPYMARIHHTTGNVSSNYLRASSIIAGVLLPVLAWVALMAHEIVFLLFGNQWLAAATAIPWLCVATAISTLFSLSTYTVISIGRPFVALIPLLMLITGKLVAIYFIYEGTLTSFSIAIAVGEMISIPGYLYINKKYLNIEVKTWFLLTLQTIIPVASVTVISAQAISYIDYFNNVIIQIFISLTMLIGLCIVAYWIAKPPIIEEIKNAFSSLRKKTNAT